MTDHAAEKGAYRALAHLLAEAVSFTDAYNAFADGDRGMESHVEAAIYDVANAALAFAKAQAAYNGDINHRPFIHGPN